MMPIFNNCPTPSHFSPCTSTSELSSSIYVGAKLPASSSFFSSLIKALAAFCHKDVGICGVDLSPSDMCRLQPFCCSQDSLKRAYHTIRYHQSFQKIEDQGFLCPFSTGRASFNMFQPWSHRMPTHVLIYSTYIKLLYYILATMQPCKCYAKWHDCGETFRKLRTVGRATVHWYVQLAGLTVVVDAYWRPQRACFTWPKNGWKSSVKSEHMGQRRALHEPRIKSLEDHGLYMTLKWLQMT